MESHWQKKSPVNKGKFDTWGKVTFDVTQWQKDGRMKRRGKGDKKRGQEHWVITFDIVMEMVGLDIKCWASYPPVETEEGVVVRTAYPRGDMIEGTLRHGSLVGSFEPGTV
jgi:hypothetical protein